MTEKQLNSLVDGMTLEEKAAQLTQVNVCIIYDTANKNLTGAALSFGLSEEAIFSVGSVLNFADDEREKIQSYYLENSKRKIPLVFMHDVIHGYRTIFPIPLALGCSFDTQIVEDCAKMSAKESRAAGVDVTFSPMVDLVRDCRWGRVMESTGEDHYLNGEMGKAFIRGYHKGGVACCVKHFAAYGAPEAGREYNTVEMSDYTLQEFYYHAYRECLKENPELVMSSFNVLNGKPVNGRKDVLIDILREKWGFDGVLISDYNAVEEMMRHGFAEDRKACANIALNNQIDMEMMSVTYVDYLKELVRDGKLLENTVNKLVKRVLRLKDNLGLFDNPNGGYNRKQYEEICLSDTHREIVRNAAEKSFVLLKNQGVLPLKKQENVAFIGPFVEERNLLGSWRAYGNEEEAQTIKESLEKYLNRNIRFSKGCDHSLFSTDESGFEEAERLAENVDTVVFCIGEHSDYSGEGKSRANPIVPEIQTKLVKKIKSLGKRTVGVIFAGRPLILTEIEPFLDSILYVWQPGTEGANAIVNTLYGENNPSGKTVMTFPCSVGQCPIHYNEFHGGRRKVIDDLEPMHCDCAGGYIDELNAPLYPFGFGLSYTHFTLYDFTVSKKEFSETDSVIASIFVKNDGDYDGEEVIQLYLCDLVASYVRPIKELKGYKKIFLKMGESKKISFEITADMLSFHDENGNLILESGKFEVMLGTSSNNVFKETIKLA